VNLKSSRLIVTLALVLIVAGLAIAYFLTR
jgi:hypothetical protein